MKLLRNREIRLQLFICLGLTAALCVAALIVSGAAAALITAVCGILVAAVNCIYLAKRYARLRDISEDIDRVLHGQESVVSGQSDEGELAVLTSEIQKMTVMLREQTDRLAAEKIRLTDAIADMFHQMRTPITSMNIQLSLLADEETDAERRIELARELKKQLERLQWLTETLLKLSKIDAGTDFRKDTISVKALVKKASEPFLIPMELRGQELRISVGDEAFDGDLSWSCEALGNLLKNCMEHTPEGGRIEVEAEETAIFTQITVTDSGPGFDPSDIPHLFERFYRGSNASEESLGIGLALSRAIVSRQNGTITAENAPGGGARFVIKFYKSIV